VFQYRPLGDDSDGVTVSVQGLRRLIGRGALDPAAFECREVGVEGWRPIDHFFRRRVSPAVAIRIPGASPLRLMASRARSAASWLAWPATMGAGMLLWSMVHAGSGATGRQDEVSAAGEARGAARGDAASRPRPDADAAGDDPASPGAGRSSGSSSSRPAASSLPAPAPTAVAPEPRDADARGLASIPARPAAAGASTVEHAVVGQRDLGASFGREGAAEPEAAGGREGTSTEVATEGADLVPSPRALEDMLPAGDWVCGAAGDVDGDPGTDFVVGREDGLIAVLVHVGGAAFRRLADVQAAGNLRTLQLQDFDRDGDLDLVAAGSRVQFWRNDGRGEFAAADDRLPAGLGPVAGLAVGDVDGDGDADVVLSDARVLRNDRGRLNLVPPEAAPGTAMDFVTLGDVDGDGYLDAVFAKRANALGRGGCNRASRNDGAGRFADVTATWMRSGQGSAALALVDLDRDGDGDLVCANRGQPPLERTRSEVLCFGDGRFQRAWPGRARFVSELAATWAVAVGDVDGDGRADVVLGNRGPDAWYRNDGRGGFVHHGLPDVDTDTRAVFLVDVDPDGQVDVVTVNHAAGLRCYRGPGSSGAAMPSDASPPGDRDRHASTAPAARCPLPAGKYRLRQHARAFLSEPAARPVRAAVDAALGFLVARQDDTGAFRAAADAGMGAAARSSGLHAVTTTGLVLLCLLAEGSSVRSGVYADCVGRGVAFLSEQQDAAGCIGDPASGAAVLDHAIATLALAEATVLSEDESLLAALERALEWLWLQQRPDGGYGLCTTAGESNGAATIWSALASIAGLDAGVAWRPEGIERTLAWLGDGIDAGGEARGRMNAPCDQGVSGAYAMLLTGGEELLAGGTVFVRLALGQSPREDGLREALERIARRPPFGDVAFTPHAWFHVANAALQLGGSRWQEWRATLHARLLDLQRRDGPDRAHWEAPGASEAEGGWLAATALATLALQADYRFARLTDPHWRGRRR